MALLSVDDALALVLKGLAPLEAEDVFLNEAHGRVLACDLVATLTQPPFDASAMDGYAVRAADVSSLPATLTVIGESVAGARFSGHLEPGQAVRIFTGAPVPDGADAIVIQEDTEPDAGRVVVKALSQERYIRPRGQDFQKGDVLLKRGTPLGPRMLMLAAAMNCETLSVRPKPRVAILATGDEVVPPGADLGPDQIVSSVPYGIAGVVEAHGAEAVNLGIAADDPESIATLARTGAGADILVTIGGASVGERDLVVGALTDEGFALDFAKVAMRPGKPVFHGRLGTQRVLGVPGNPVSALICSIVFLVPMLRAMLGAIPSGEPAPEALLDAALPANGPRQHYVRAVSTWRADGERVVHPLPSQDSSLVAALARADCLVVVPPGAEALSEGARVPIIPLAD
jgi:molybdopterin molybdotransferase